MGSVYIDKTELSLSVGKVFRSYKARDAENACIKHPRV